MNQLAIGNFIAQKRKEKNLTQAQLAEQLGVSNKTISKWECGKCMPDYSLIPSLCKELDITVSELMDGETKENGNIRIYDEQQILDLVKRVQLLEKQKQSLYGIILLVMGMALLALSQVVGGSAFRDLLGGIFLGLAIGEMLVGVYVIGASLAKE